MNTIKKLI